MSKKSARHRQRNEAVQLQVVPSTKEVIGPYLLQTVIALGLEEILEIVEQDRAKLCGPKYARDPDRQAVRGGTAPSELVLGGRRVSLRRPRARTTDGQEVVLPSWQYFAEEDPLEQRAMEQMLVGVSTRKYERSLEDVGKKVKTRGTSRSAVSRRFVTGTGKRLKELLSRDLSSLNLCTLMIDGLHMADHVALCVLGIDVHGRKHVLGLHEGATENSAACRTLLSDLQARGLRTDRSMLVVIDGSKALRKAVRDVFGKRAVIQRCQEHKIRNVTEHLPKDMKDTVRRSMLDAYRCGSYKRGLKLLRNLQRTLKAAHPGAASSLEEGLEETLTVVRLQLSQRLVRSLGTTNSMENLNSLLRDGCRRVKRWRDGAMVVRWLATGLLEAEKSFRRFRGYRDLPRLVAALRERDAELDDGLAAAGVVA